MNNLVVVVEKGLIPVMENEAGEKLVNARELHQFLGSKRKFANWIQQRIDKYEFIENVDFIKGNNFVTVGNLQRPQTDYILTIDVAKEISMVENNEKGREARKYFIACEKKLKEVIQEAPQKKLPINYIEVLEHLVIAEKENLQLQEENKELTDKVAVLEPKADYHDKVLGSEDSWTTTQVAKAFHMTAQRLNSLLTLLDIQFKKKDSYYLYASVQNMDLVKYKTIIKKGETHLQLKWTQKGRKFIYDLLCEKGYIE